MKRIDVLTRAGAVLLALAGASLTGCATHVPYQAPPAFIHHGPVVGVDEVEVLSLSPEMRDFLQRYVTAYSNPDTRVILLTTAITDPAMLGFRYDSRRTLTAQQAFEQRTGNCIGFSNLVVALARAAGLEAQFQEITLEPEWYSRDDTLMVAKHVNVRINVGVRSWAVDTSGVRTRPGDRRRLISDREALALYYNNLAVDALVAGDQYRAWAWLERSVATAPDLPDAWINLGVVYARNGQLEDAERMYQRVLKQHPEQSSALSNLYALYESVDDQAAMARLAPRVERYRQLNPYYLMVKGEEALDAGNYAAARDWLGGAIEKKPGEHRFHFLLARAEFLDNDVALAEASLARARELAPSDVAEDYARPLAELSTDP